MDRTFGKYMKKAGALMLALSLLVFCATALADMEAGADKTSVQEGDEVAITLTVTGKDLSVAKGEFTYDPALLSFKEGDGASDGFFALYSAEKDGSATLRARIVFTALAAGEAKVDFTLTSLVNYKGSALDTESASVTVSIAAAPVEPTPTPKDYSSSALSVKAENVQGSTVDMYVWRSIENVTIPSRYTEADVTYKGETVKGATVSNSDAPTLLYLSDATGGNAGYYIYDAAHDTLYPYQTVSTVSKSYILLIPDGSVSVPAGFTETTLTIDDEAVQAWKSADAQGELYLLYARNPDGEVGFYLYNPEDESLQRFAVLPARPVVTPVPATTPAPVTDLVPQETVPVPAQQPEGQIALNPALFWALAGAAALFLILFGGTLAYHLADKARRKKRAAERRKQMVESMKAAEQASSEQLTIDN